MSDFKSIADVPEMLELWDFDKILKIQKRFLLFLVSHITGNANSVDTNGLQRLVPVPAQKGNVLPAKEPGKDPIPLKIYHF